MNKQELHQQWHLTYTWYSGRNSTCGILSLKETHLGRSKLNRHVMEPLKPTSDADTLSSKAKYLQNHPETYSKSQFQWAPWWEAHRALKNNLGSLSWHRISLEPELKSKLKFLNIWWSHWFSQALVILSSKTKYLQNHSETNVKSQFHWAPCCGPTEHKKTNIGSLKLAPH